MRKQVLLTGSEMLRMKSRPFKWQDDPLHETLELMSLLDDMNETMIAENGMGLAANQIGYTLRIFILKDMSGRGFSEYINPEVLSEEELVTFENEGCLSIPGVTAATKRFRKLSLRWQDFQGKTHEGSFEDIGAFAVQHEMDHLDGKLYVDQLGPVMRSLVLKKHKKHVRALRRRG
jgi:peptide deformylase